MAGYNTTGSTHRVVDPSEALISNYDDPRANLTHDIISENQLLINQSLRTPGIGQMSHNQPSLFTGGTRTGEEQEVILYILMNHIDITYLNTYQFMHSLSKDDRLLKFKCRDCSNFEFKTTMSCGHSVCLLCLHNNLKKFESFQSLKLWKSLRCPQCYLLPTNFELFSLFNRNQGKLNSFLSSNLQKTCSWCRRSLKIMTHYYPELKCLHLCKNCYLDQLFCKIKTCMVCNEEFSNKKFTLQREEKCLACEKIFKNSHNAFKCYKEGMICFTCQNKAIQKNETFEQLMIDMELTRPVFTKFFNKFCGECGGRKALSELRICQKCYSIICENCRKQEYNCNVCRI